VVFRHLANSYEENNGKHFLTYKNTAFYPSEQRIITEDVWDENVIFDASGQIRFQPLNTWLGEQT